MPLLKKFPRGVDSAAAVTVVTAEQNEASLVIPTGHVGGVIAVLQPNPTVYLLAQ